MFLGMKLSVLLKLFVFNNNISGSFSYLYIKLIINSFYYNIYLGNTNLISIFYSSNFYVFINYYSDKLYTNVSGYTIVFFNNSNSIPQNI